MVFNTAPAHGAVSHARVITGMSCVVMMSCRVKMDPGSAPTVGKTSYELQQQLPTLLASKTSNSPLEEHTDWVGTDLLGWNKTGGGGQGRPQSFGGAPTPAPPSPHSKPQVKFPLSVIPFLLLVHKDCLDSLRASCGRRER